jgi:hypothetical protein
MINDASVVTRKKCPVALIYFRVVFDGSPGRFMSVTVCICPAFKRGNKDGCLLF